MSHGGRCLLPGCPLGDRDVLANNFSGRVKEAGLPDFLGKGLIGVNFIEQSLAFLHLSACQSLGPVVLILEGDVGNISAEGRVLSHSASLGWVREQVAWANHHFSGVLLRLEVLFHLHKILHVLVGRIGRLSNVPGGPERFLVAALNLFCAILIAKDGLGSLLEGVSDGVVGRLTKLDTVDFTSLDGACSDVGWVDRDLFHLSTGHEASCCRKTSWLGK